MILPTWANRGSLQVNTSQILVHVLPVTDLDDEDHEPPALNHVDHAIVADAQPIEPFLGVEELRPWQAWVLAQGIDLSRYQSLGVFGESGKFLLRRLEEFDRVRQAAGLQPQVSLHLRPGHPNPILGISQGLTGRLDVQVVFKQLKEAQVCHWDHRHHSLAPALDDHAVCSVRDLVDQVGEGVPCSRRFERDQSPLPPSEYRLLDILYATAKMDVLSSGDF